MKSFYEVYTLLLIEEPEDICNILVIVELMIIISPSTAGCERSFHIVNLVKNKLRTRLLNDTMNILLKIAEGGASIEDFDPNPVIDLWVRASNMKELSLWNVQLPSIFTACENEMASTKPVK